MVLVHITKTKHTREIFQTSKVGKLKEREKNYISQQIFLAMIPPNIERCNRAKQTEGVEFEIQNDFQFVQSNYRDPQKIQEYSNQYWN